jgi:hypothetical protein
MDCLFTLGGSKVVKGVISYIKDFINNLREVSKIPVRYHYFEIGDLKIVCRSSDETIKLSNILEIASKISKRRNLELEDVLNKVYETYKQGGIKRADEYSDHIVSVKVTVNGKEMRINKNSEFIFVELK